jgi:methyltransferase (TIGR00027 family)
VRSRVAEDSFAAAHARGVRSYVIVGAGLDTFAYRSQLAGVRVIEIDHPATQADKRARLAAAAIAIPDGVSYAPVDFEHETLRDGLVRAGLGGEPAVFAWLGVTPYLSYAALTQTLRDLAAAAPGSELVFDFAAPATGDHAAGRERLAARVGALGEPLRSELDPDALTDQLRGLGFSRVEIADHAALAARYFTDRRDGLRLRGGHIARAWV